MFTTLNAIRKHKPCTEGTTTIDVDGVQRHALNSNGQPIHWSEEGISNFWRWFGDSEIVDEHGRPLVVYHGTDSPDVECFDPDKLGENTGASSARKGYFFASNPDNAAFYPVYPLELIWEAHSTKGIDRLDFMRMSVTELVDKKALTGVAAESAARFEKITKQIESENYYSSTMGAEVGLQALFLNKLKNQMHPDDVIDFDSLPDNQKEFFDELKSAASNNRLWGDILSRSLANKTSASTDEVFEGKADTQTIQPNVLPVYLKIENPLSHDYDNAGFRDAKFTDLIDQADENDGLILKNTNDPYETDVYIAFSPTQIKSVFNRGTFECEEGL